MKDLNYPTCFDIYGDEHYIMKTRRNGVPKLKIEFEVKYGGLVENPRGNLGIIITQELKDFIQNNDALHASEFGECLRHFTIRNLRRKFKVNPYKSYEAWRDSKKKNKPKEVFFLDQKENPEYITDIFEQVYVLASAKIAKNGITMPMGILKDIYFSKDTKRVGKKNIITKEIAAFIKAHQYHPVKVSKELSISTPFFFKMREELGYTMTRKAMNTFVAAHLNEIFTMDTKVFIERYVQVEDLGKGGLIYTFKKGISLLLQHSKSKDKKEKEIFAEIQSLEEVSSVEINKKIQIHYAEEKARYFVKAYQILMVARDYNYTMPNELRKLLKKQYA